MTQETVILPDGYNGHTARFYAQPIETDGNLVKLRCAEPGKEYMTSWKHRLVVARAVLLSAVESK